MAFKNLIRIQLSKKINLNDIPALANPKTKQI